MTRTHEDELELAWAAGFFDGEGHCGIAKGRPRLTIGQREREPLERLQSALGGVGRINVHQVGGRIYYKLEIGAFDEVAHACGLLLGHVCSVKAAQIGTVWGAYNEHPPVRRGTPEWKERIYTPERNAKISAALTGWPKSPEHRAALSAARKGKGMSRAKLAGKGDVK